MIFLSALLLALQSSIVPVYAVSTPHVIVPEELWLLDVSSAEKLFLLPESYYAKIDNMDDTYYYVSFNNVSGKVEKALCSTVGYHTQAAGTMQELRIDPKFSDFKTLRLRSAFGGGGEEIMLNVSDSFIFIGKYPSTENWYYIKYGDGYGYIKAERTTAPNLELPRFVPESETEEETVQPPAEEKKETAGLFPSVSSNTVRILIIIGLCLPVVLLIFLLFRPSKNKKYYYDK